MKKEKANDFGDLVFMLYFYQYIIQVINYLIKNVHDITLIDFT